MNTIAEFLLLGLLLLLLIHGGRRPRKSPGENPKSPAVLRASLPLTRQVEERPAPCTAGPVAAQGVKKNLLSNRNLKEAVILSEILNNPYL